jgi:soluble P-type ATPase
MRFFCPKCWSDYPEDAARCPTCGLDILTFWRGKNYVEKLIAALDHPEAETPERAARILGNLGEEGAVESLIKLVSKTEDVYVARAAVEALAQIGTPQACDFLVKVAQSHRARMVREAAKGTTMNKKKRGGKDKTTDPPFLRLPVAEGVIIPFSDLVLDYSGTLSQDGTLLPGIAQRLRDMAKIIRVSVLTADTFGKAVRQLGDIPIEVKVVRTGTDKADFVRRLGPERVIAIGNGRNDVPMMSIAGLSVAVIGPEGAAGELLRVAHVIVTDIHHALDLIIHPLRWKAVLRD